MKNTIFCRSFALRLLTALILLNLTLIIPSSARSQAPAWAWMGGNPSTTSSVYGMEYQFAPTNVPGSRSGEATWTDQNGRLWLFGGSGDDSLGTSGDLRFDPSQGAGGAWAWIRGSNIANTSGLGLRTDV
jgi:hypothetical protein